VHRWPLAPVVRRRYRHVRSAVELQLASAGAALLAGLQLPGRAPVVLAALAAEEDVSHGRFIPRKPVAQSPLKFSARKPTTPNEMSPELYCLIPAELAGELLEPLREHFAGTHVQVIVERRDPRSTPSYSMLAQRRRHLPRSLGELPEADLTLLEVVKRAAAADGQAATELAWRIYARVESRVHPEHVDATLGRILDIVGEWPGGTEMDFYAWLDRVMAPPAMAGRMTSVSFSDTPV
jgi:hypothetical protein